MEEFKKAYGQLNKQQKLAVETIQGPVLVIAGPGTGKTQLLSTRVGYILSNTDALAQNILCMTFTETGVDAMRERLTELLGQAAYDIALSTYHAFGSELIRRYPEYVGGYDFKPIDELGADSLIREILAAASYSNPLKSADTYAHDLRAFMSDCKRALLKPDNVGAIVKENQTFIIKSSKEVAKTLKNFKRVDKTSLAMFERLAVKLQTIADKSSPPATSLKTMCLGELIEALRLTSESGRTKPLTAWKNSWLAKDDSGQFILAGGQANQKLAAAADIYSLYQEMLAKRKLYDYDDMILRTIEALEKHPEFKFTLAEQYQYILLDEFQDTNPAQFKIIELLTDNPVNEGRPNVMAVGDDDQGIYAFQGASHTNMYRFAQLYRNVRVISLRENYRSHREILDIAYNISGQIKDRLHERFEGITKILKEASSALPKRANIAHHEFISDAAQYAWVASQIKQLVAKRRVAPDEITVLAPKHRYLIPLLPFLAGQGLAVRYEKRENVLDKPIIRQLEQMSRLVLALADRDRPAIDALWPEILSYGFWKLPTELIWKISWKADSARENWTNTLLLDPVTKPVAEFLLRLKDLLAITTLEQQLDILTGVTAGDVKEYSLPLRCPLFEYYFGGKKAKDTIYLELLNDLGVLRGRLRDWRRNETRPFSLRDFIVFIDAHRASDINILNSSPHYESKSAVNIMTAYQAKGREFSVVFILAAHDGVWVATSRSANSSINLPPNLRYIRYRGGSDDERLRLLYVAITRAKTHLYLTSYSATLDGKKSRPLKFLIGQAGLKPIAAELTQQPIGSDDLQNYWHLRHVPPFKPKLADLLEPVLARYQLSPTHLNQFIDVQRGGPEQFFLNSILRFPKGQPPSASFGTAMHESLRWIHDTNAREFRLPKLGRVLSFFGERLEVQRLSQQDNELLLERGQEALKAYLKQSAASFSVSDVFEHNFRNEGVFEGQAHLSGKIDKLVIDKKTKTITVVDFKTGKSYDRWQPNILKLHKYRQQLLMYKLLVEGSHSYPGYRVNQGILEFVEPNTSGRICSLRLGYDTAELGNLKRLIEAIWRRIQSLDFQNASQYPPTITGIKVFEQDLIENG